MKNNKITVKGSEISILHIDKEDYISLTDIALHKDPDRTDFIIQNWLRNRNTVELLGFWEQLYNPDFKPVEFDGFRKQAGLNSFTMTSKKWIESTNAIGIISKSGVMVVLLHIRILLLNLLHGFQLNLSCTYQKSFND